MLFKIYDIYVYVIAREGVKLGINFTSCSENDNDIAQGAAMCYFAIITITSGIYPKISLLPVLSKFNSKAYFDEVKWQLQLTFCVCIGWRLTHFPPV